MLKLLPVAFFMTAFATLSQAQSWTAPVKGMTAPYYYETWQYDFRVLHDVTIGTPESTQHLDTVCDESKHEWALDLQQIDTVRQQSALGPIYEGIFWTSLESRPYTYDVETREAKPSASGTHDVICVRFH